MTNEIESIRESLRQDLAAARLCPQDGFTEPSPCGRYLLSVEAYATAQCPDYASIAVATVRDATTDEVLVTLNRNDDLCFYAWVNRDGHDYLLFAEDIEGHSVSDLTAGRVEGFSSRDDGFIWAEIFPSPNRERLAVIGCYWACSYELVVYDFREPMRLPLPVMERFDLPGNDAKFGGWDTDAAFRIVDRAGIVRVIELTMEKTEN